MIFFKQFIFWGSYFAFPFALFVGWLLMRKKCRILAIILGILTLLFLYARFIEPHFLVVKQERMDFSPDSTLSSEVRIAVFSDVHLGIYKKGKNLFYLAEKVNRENPDFVLIPGDFLYHIDEEKLESEFAFLGEIEAPVFAVTGNHDVGFPGPILGEEMHDVLRKYGVVPIDNAIETIRMKEKEIVLIGLSDRWEGQNDMALLEKISKQDFSIVLTHNPDTTHDFPQDHTIDLVVSGHTHGGQVRIPWLYKKVIPCEYPFDKGWHNANNTHVYVTPGIGMVGIPLRFLMPPELDILTLQI